MQATVPSPLADPQRCAAHSLPKLGAWSPPAPCLVCLDQGQGMQAAAS